MESATYLEQTYDLIRYIVSQIDFPDLSEYTLYFFVGGIILAVSLIIITIIKKKRAVNEYLEDGVCLKIEFPPMSDKKAKITDLLKVLHEKSFGLFKSKYYFALEVLIKDKELYLFLFLPAVLYEHLTECFKEGLKVDVVTEEREKFLDNLEESVKGLKLELARDFIFPLELLSKQTNSLSSDLVLQEWIFLQILMRPIGTKWLRLVDNYLESLRSGKDITKSTVGCLGGCLGITFPFFSLLGDLVTSLVHGSSGRGKKASKEAGLTEGQRQTLEVVSKKKDSFGFEVLARAFVKASCEERSYMLLEKFLNLVSNDAPLGNSFVVSESYDKFKSNLENDLLLANMEKSTTDVLSVPEIVNLVSQFY